MKGAISMDGYYTFEELKADKLAWHFFTKGYSVAGAEAAAHNQRRANPGLSDEEIVAKIGGLSPQQVLSLTLKANPRAVKKIAQKLAEEHHPERDA